MFCSEHSNVSFRVCFNRISAAVGWTRGGGAAAAGQIHPAFWADYGSHIIFTHIVLGFFVIFVLGIGTSNEKHCRVIVPLVWLKHTEHSTVLLCSAHLGAPLFAHPSTQHIRIRMCADS